MKIIIDIQFRGKCVQVVEKYSTGPYEIHVDDELIKDDIDAVTVIRWLGNVMENAK